MWMLMKEARPAESMARRNWLLEVTAMREMLEESWKGRVMVRDLVRSVAEMRFPIGESRVLSVVTFTLPPRYGAASRFWNRKFISEVFFS